MRSQRFTTEASVSARPACPCVCYCFDRWPLRCRAVLGPRPTHTDTHGPIQGSERLESSIILLQSLPIRSAMKQAFNAIIQQQRKKTHTHKRKQNKNCIKSILWIWQCMISWVCLWTMRFSLHVWLLIMVSDKVGAAVSIANDRMWNLMGFIIL